MIWEPFVLALVLGLVVSAGLYFAYLWPSVEPLDEPVLAAASTAAVVTDIPVRDETDKPADDKGDEA